MFFEFEKAPYHVLDVDVAKPTARGGQTLVRVKMPNRSGFTSDPRPDVPVKKP